jgi:hypothetical protein
MTDLVTRITAMSDGEGGKFGNLLELAKEEPSAPRR